MLYVGICVYKKEKTHDIVAKRWNYEWRYDFRDYPHASVYSAKYIIHVSKI